MAEFVFTDTMLGRCERVGGTWKHEGGGYFSLIGSGFGTVAYVALPEGHPDIGANMYDLEPDVNGGLTYGQDNVFGWDYAHEWDMRELEDTDEEPRSITDDIASALTYFRGRETKRIAAHG